MLDQHAQLDQFSQLSRPRGAAASNHIYDIEGSDFTAINNKISLAPDSGGLSPKVDLAQASAILRPAVGVGPEALLNEAEYLSSNNASLFALIDSANFGINVKFRPTDFIVSRTLLGFGPASGHGYFWWQMLSNGRLRITMRNTTPVTVTVDLGTGGTGSPLFVAGADYSVNINFHDSVMDYSIETPTVPLTEVLTGYPFSFAGSDAVWSQFAFGAGFAATFRNEFKGAVKYLKFTDLAA